MPKEAAMDAGFRELLSVEGQIIFSLICGERFAGDIYFNVSATQTTVSRKIARLLDQGKIEQHPDQVDRRRTKYRLSKRYIGTLRESGLKFLFAFQELI
jgi:DNA-binding MarR family transcriptional regulator